MDYTDFVIRARDWQDGQFKVEVTDSPADRTRQPEEVVYAPQLPAWLRRLERKSLPLPELVALGRALAGMLLPPTVRQMLLTSLEMAGQEGGLRLRLVLDDLRLANIPWEYVYLSPFEDQDDLFGFLALNPRISIVRHEAMPMPPGQVKVVSPLKVAVGMASPAGLPQLNLAAERDFIQAALADLAGVQVQYVDHLTVPLLETVCQGAHLFHFAGHGAFFWREENENYGDGVLFLEDAVGERLPFPVHNLALTLRGAGVRVVVLGSCETGRRDGVNPWSGIAPALMRVGIPAAVAMQYSVYDHTAIAFSRRFYQALASGLSLDEAVALGRLAMMNEGGQDNADWGVPVLYMRAGDGVIFAPRAGDTMAGDNRESLLLNISQQAQAVRAWMRGADLVAVHNPRVDVQQAVEIIEPGGEVLGARVDDHPGAVVKTQQRVERVEAGGRLEGIRLRRRGEPEEGR